MKLLKIVLFAVIALYFYFSLHSAALEYPDLRIENASALQVEIVYPEYQIIEPNNFLTFSWIPQTITFKSGQLSGILGSPQKFDIAHNVNIAQIASDSTLVISISTAEYFQFWSIRTRLEKKSAVIKKQTAEPATVSDPLDLFPMILIHKGSALSQYDRARYIIGMSDDFTRDELEKKYESERQRLVDLITSKTNVVPIPIIVDAIRHLNEALETLRKKLQEPEEHEKISPAQARQQSIEFAENLRAYLMKETGVPFHYLSEGRDLDIIPDGSFQDQYLRGILSGGNRTLRVQDFNRAPVDEKPTVLRKLVNEYKIHLMPKDKDLKRISKKLIEEIKRNPKLQEVIGYIKIKPIVEMDEKMEKERHRELYGLYPEEFWNLPRIVIIVGGGRAAAQLALDEIYKIFKEEAGLNRGPGYNQEVTSLIYFSHGNRDDKVGFFRQYFEQPNMIYYDANITGTPENYHLTIPRD